LDLLLNWGENKMSKEQSNQKNIQDFSGEELALLMQREYEQIIRSQGTLVVLDKEIQRRLATRQKETESIESTTSTNKGQDNDRTADEPIG
jgi:Na+/phosphate symporter